MVSLQFQDGVLAVYQSGSFCGYKIQACMLWTIRIPFNDRNPTKNLDLKSRSKLSLQPTSYGWEQDCSNSLMPTTVPEGTLLAAQDALVRVICHAPKLIYFSVLYLLF